MALVADFIPITEVKVGDRRVGGIVTGIRISKSGKSIWFMMRSISDPNREFEWPPESTLCRAAIFTETDE